MKDEDGKVLEEGDEVIYAIHDGSFKPEKRTGVISRIRASEAEPDFQEGAYCVRATGETRKRLVEHGIVPCVVFTNGGFVMLKRVKKARTSKDVDAGSYDDVYNEKVGRQLEESLNETEKRPCSKCGQDMNRAIKPIILDDNPVSIAGYLDERCNECGRLPETGSKELKELREDLDILFEEIRKVEKRIIALEGG